MINFTSQCMVLIAFAWITTEVRIRHVLLNQFYFKMNSFVTIWYCFISILVIHKVSEIACQRSNEGDGSIYFAPRPWRKTTVSPATTKGTKPNSNAIKSKSEIACKRYRTLACGSKKDPDVTQLIVNGRKAMPKEFPHMALIGYGDDFSEVEWKCGGTLISERFVLSAAHCVVGYNPKWVRLGELDLESTTEPASPIDYSIIQQIVHPNYRSPSVYNDIALFKLNTTVRYNQFIRPICLQSVHTLNFSADLSASGWGQTNIDEIGSSQLLAVTLKLYDLEKCKEAYPPDETLQNGITEDSQICAGYELGEKDTCRGDSGGPLQYKLNESCARIYSQVGVVSFGKGCALAKTPGIYTRISHFIPWIEKIVWK